MPVSHTIKKISINKVKSFLISFYIIGFLGFIIPYSFEIFKYLTAPAILLNVFLLTLFHRHKLDNKTIFIFLLIFIVGIAFEIIGVNTGIIFGNYTYGSVLGLKIFKTPLIIGLNWLMLSYISTSVVEPFKINDFSKILLATIIMVFYDLIIENVAPSIGLWYWSNDIIQLKNFIAWFIISLFFNSLIKFFKINTDNPLSRHILGLQIAFFGLLVLYFKYIK
jgi:putative membrane protein